VLCRITVTWKEVEEEMRADRTLSAGAWDFQLITTVRQHKKVTMILTCAGARLTGSSRIC
jgi:hypothetical protein